MWYNLGMICNECERLKIQLRVAKLEKDWILSDFWWVRLVRVFNPHFMTGGIKPSQLEELKKRGHVKTVKHSEWKI